MKRKWIFLMAVIATVFFLNCSGGSNSGGGSGGGNCDYCSKSGDCSSGYWCGPFTDGRSRCVPNSATNGYRCYGKSQGMNSNEMILLNQ
jgi:hypothetical protein